MKKRIANRGLERHCIDKVHRKWLISHKTHIFRSATHADDQLYPVDAGAWGGGSQGACVGVMNIASLTEEKKDTKREMSALCVGAAALTKN